MITFMKTTKNRGTQIQHSKQREKKSQKNDRRWRRNRNFAGKCLWRWCHLQRQRRNVIWI